MRPHYLPFLALFILSTLRAAAQDDCCCCDFRQKGQTEYNAGRYQSAIKKWQLGQRCPDAAQCPTLGQLIREAQTHLPKPKPKPAQTTPATPEPVDADGDALWNVVKDSQDPNTLKKFLNQYPWSGHADSARQRISVLDPLWTSRINRQFSAKNAPKGFAFVQGRKFQMGDFLREGRIDEQPVHQVYLSDFYMSQTEVTFEEYDTFCMATHRPKPDDSGWGREKRPVINVDWYDAVEYCNWRSQQAGLSPVYLIEKNGQDSNNQSPEDTKKWVVRVNWYANGYRLPTEAEWEFAARSPINNYSNFTRGSEIRFGNGENVADPDKINFDASQDYKKNYARQGIYRKQTVPVGSLNNPNGLGIHDLAGNVYEWCHDWYGSTWYRENTNIKVTVTDPSGPASGESRCARGGCWFYGPENCRNTDRNHWPPDYRSNYIGFRLVRH